MSMAMTTRAFAYLGSILFISITKVSADLSCSTSTSSTGVCGVAGSPGSVVPYYIEAIYEERYLQSEACATACANIPSCQSFSIYNGAQDAPAFCQLYNDTSANIGFEPDPTTTDELQWDLSCFACAESYPGCSPTPVGCSKSPVSDPSFENDEGEWSFSNGGIVASTSDNPARTGTHIAQFVFSGQQFELFSGSLSQTLSLCNGTKYALSGYFSSPAHSPGVECDLYLSLGGQSIYTQPLQDDDGSYYPFLFPDPYIAVGQSEVLEIDISCEYNQDGEGDVVINFDDISMNVCDSS